MNNYEIVERKPTSEELEELRKLVNWGIPSRNALDLGLKNSLYGVCAVIDGKVVGTARVVGDGSTCFYVQDVIVHPEFQRKGIGLSIMEQIMNYVRKNACNGAIVGLMSAKGKEEFYERFGFWTRPNEHFGHGMMQFWKR
jgi:GNAT superfamily N-acetyltransferase